MFLSSITSVHLSTSFWLNRKWLWEIQPPPSHYDSYRKGGPQEGISSVKDLSRLQPSVCLAQEVGGLLARGEVVFPTLPEKGQVRFSEGLSLAPSKVALRCCGEPLH